MKCPKCGSETETDDGVHYQCTDLGCMNAWFPFTYEEKVGDPPSCCGQEMLALNASKSEWKCLACGSKIGGEKR